MKLPRFALIIIGAVAVAAAGAGAWALTESARRTSAVAARVNGEVILWSQVDAEIERTAAQFGMDVKNPGFEKQRAELTKAVIDQLVAQRLVMQEAQKRNLVATTKDVDERLAAIKRQFPDEATFNKRLAQAGLTVSAVRELIRVQISQRRVAEAVAKADVTEQEVRQQFEAKRESYGRPAQLKVSHILFRVADKSQEAVANAKAKIVQARLADGAKFEDVARQYSEDPGSAERGGDLGFVSKGTLVKEFEDVAWSLKPGQTSGLVRTQFGLHIIRVYEIRAAEPADYDKVKSEIREELLNTKRQKEFDTWLAEHRKTAKIETFERQ
jgi:parvulin-like peptidyl-prolyl isomerase